MEELIELSVAGVGSADFAEGQRAFAEKRQPTWTGMYGQPGRIAAAFSAHREREGPCPARAVEAR